MAKDRPPSFQFFPANWISDTLLMSPDKRGRYITALCLSWVEKSYGVAPEDLWRRWLGYTTKQWGSVRDDFSSRFVVSGEAWTQKKLAECRADQIERLERASKGGVAKNNQGGHAHSSKTTSLALPLQVVANTRQVGCLASASGVLGECLAPTPYSDSDTEEESKPKDLSTGVDESGPKKLTVAQDWMLAFDEFWDEYPARGNPPAKGGKAEARKAWAKIKPSKESAAAIWKALDAHKLGWPDPQFIPLAATWLNKGRWQDAL